MKTVLIADDHAIMRRTLMSFLESKTYDVVSAIEHGDAVVRAVQEHRPDLLILDLNMPGRGGLDILSDLSGMNGAPDIVVLTTHAEPAYVQVALARGASAYVRKSRSIRELADALAAVSSGKPYISPSISMPGSLTPPHLTGASSTNRAA